MLHQPSRSVEGANDSIISNRSNPVSIGMPDKNILKLLMKADTIEEIISATCFDERTEDYTGYGQARFYKVNFSSIPKCGTVEFR